MTYFPHKFTVREDRSAINAAGVAYANSTSTAFELFDQQVADHLLTYVNSVTGAARTWGEAKALADKNLKIATANVNYSQATDANFDHAAAMTAAYQAFSNIVDPATTTYENAKKTAAETRSRDDALSQKDVDTSLAAAEKTYDDAVAAARRTEDTANSAAAEDRANALSALDASIESLADSSWASRLGDSAMRPLIHGSIWRQTLQQLVRRVAVRWPAQIRLSTMLRLLLLTLTQRT